MTALVLNLALATTSRLHIPYLAYSFRIADKNVQMNCSEWSNDRRQSPDAFRKGG